MPQNNKKKSLTVVKPKGPKIAAKVTGVPAAVGTSYKRPNPKITTSPSGDITVTHLEFVTDVPLLSSFNVFNLPINPQAPGTFPWLFAISTRYEMYRFVKLTMHYRPSVSTATDGYIIIGADFDSYDAAPTRYAMMNWKTAVKCAVWEACDIDLTHESRLAIARYCNSSSPIGADKRLDDLGNFWIATDSPGLAAAKQAGELFISYTVQLKIPSLKYPNALYFQNDVDVGIPVANNDYFGNTLTIFNESLRRANMIVRWIARDIIRIDTPGQYIITTNTGGTSATVGNYTTSIPVDAPNSEYTWQQLMAFADASSGTMTSISVFLTAGSVLLQLAGLSAIPSRVITRISTYGSINL
jgi:hypothetical protein